MKINSLKTLTSLAVAMAFLFAGSAFGEEEAKVSIKKPSKFWVVDGKPLDRMTLDLCKDLKKVLNEPENKNFGEPYITNSEFIIPKKYKDFREPVWQDVSMEELPQYMASEWLNKIKQYNEDYKSESFKFLTQRTRVDLNHDGIKDDILRLKPNNNKRLMKGLFGTNWHCFVSDVVPTEMSKNNNEYGETGISTECRLFVYRGKVFKAGVGEKYDSMFVWMPTSPLQRPQFGYKKHQFGYKDACLISFTPSKSKIAGLALDEEVKNR